MYKPFSSTADSEMESITSVATSLQKFSFACSMIISSLLGGVLFVCDGLAFEGNVSLQSGSIIKVYSIFLVTSIASMGGRHRVVFGLLLSSLDETARLRIGILFLRDGRHQISIQTV